MALSISSSCSRVSSALYAAISGRLRSEMSPSAAVPSPPSAPPPSPCLSPSGPPPSSASFGWSSVSSRIFASKRLRRAWLDELGSSSTREEDELLPSNVGMVPQEFDFYFLFSSRALLRDPHPRDPGIRDPEIRDPHARVPQTNISATWTSLASVDTQIDEWATMLLTITCQSQ